MGKFFQTAGLSVLMPIFFKKIFFAAVICLIGIMSPAFFTVKNEPENFIAQASVIDTLVNVLVVCGDGFVDTAYETCDPGNPSTGIRPSTGTTTCQNFINPNTNLPFVSGTLTCNDTCTYFSTSTCNTCPDGVRQAPMEECDTNDFGGGSSCADYGYTSGTLHCAPGCRLDLSNCVVIGQPPTTGGTPTTGGGGGGNSGRGTGFLPGQKNEPEKTQVIIKGKSYPNSDVRVLIDDKVVGIVRADSKADFSFSTEDVTPGINTFGLWTEDNRGLKSTLLTLTFRVASKSITTISNVYISPTIDVDKKKVNRGSIIKIFGKSSPEVPIKITVNSLTEKNASSTSSVSGDWSLNFDTKELEEDFHTAKALIRLNSPEGIIESNYSRTVSFYVGQNVGEEGKCGPADLNCDGSVNLVDFSILLYHWGTTDETGDINKDGKVGLTDFSIMMFYWTG